MADLLKAAEQYAKTKKTKVIAHKINGDEITFVLEAGQKLTMTEAELKPEPEAKAKEPTPAKQKGKPK